MAVDGFPVGLYQYTLSVRTHDIAADIFHLGIGSIKQCLQHLSCLKGVTGDGLSIITKLRIALTISSWCHTTDIVWYELSTGDLP